MKEGDDMKTKKADNRKNEIRILFWFVSGLFTAWYFIPVVQEYFNGVLTKLTIKSEKEKLKYQKDLSYAQSEFGIGSYNNNYSHSAIKNEIIDMINNGELIFKSYDNYEDYEDYDDGDFDE